MHLIPEPAKGKFLQGLISSRAATIFVIINAVLFIITSGFINRLTLILSPVALLVIIGYSLTKEVHLTLSFCAWSWT